MNVILISGLGPALMETEDLKGTFYDSEDMRVRKRYCIGEKYYSPENLVYHSDGKMIPLLRPRPKLKQSDYISQYLKGILTQACIDYTFVPIKHIWNDEAPKVELHEKSIVCLSTTFMWNERMLDHAISWIYKWINCCYLIIGGQYSVLKQEYILSNWMEMPHSKVFLQTGEAELSLVPLIEHLQAEKNIEALRLIPNILSKSAHGTVCHTFEQNFDFNTVCRVRFPEQNNYIPYMSMRGCPYRCKFCALRECTPKWQYHSAQRIYQDWIAYANENGGNHFTINDSTFFIPYSKVTQLLSLLENSHFTWDANARTDTPFDSEAVKTLEKAGCTALFFGFESMCNATLCKMDKLTTADDNRRINTLFADSPIATKMSFIVGFPGETPEDFLITQEYLVHEHVGRYNLYVFEYESDILPIGREKEKYQLQLLPESGHYHWAHAGEHWTHCGMNSDTARKLRKQTMQKTRITPNSMAVSRTWQDEFDWPYIPEMTKKDNIKIEKLLDRLVFAPQDVDEASFEEYIVKIIGELASYHISLKQ